MATKVMLPKDVVAHALKQSLESSKRAMTGAKPSFRAIHEQDIAALTNAINTLSEVSDK